MIWKHHRLVCCCVRVSFKWLVRWTVNWKWCAGITTTPVPSKLCPSILEPNLSNETETWKNLMLQCSGKCYSKWVSYTTDKWIAIVTQERKNQILDYPLPFMGLFRDNESIIQMGIIGLRIPTGRRRTSWLLTRQGHPTSIFGKYRFGRRFQI